MASQARSFKWFAAILAVLVWVLCAVPLAAQSNGRIRILDGSRARTQPDATATVVLDSPAEGVPATADALLEQMSLAAGIVFAGEVKSVRQPTGFAGSGQDAAEGIVEIDLRVEQSLRGPTTGSIYTLREWAGLWAGHAERFRVGQRLLLFLYAPDAHGLTAPVHGAEGAIPLRGGGIAPGRTTLL